ncbi:aromatic ring-opening dioxygenase LigA [Actinotalea sp. K2]|uniref:aromatic ring-opening dioxygenase LigA n=1 Tax=Actinotalea sp. K2 TaxID=2939438 RepID=UPI0020173925|nr:aromatic ring-opening dioxygenase LigA [Actinotalea sp. K2]MCL3863274.1 aromatic ring-opening dioxygenase LigA [Actinotalea sp. K2]
MHPNAKPVRLVGLIAIIAGVVLIVGGALTWGMVRSQLAAENITLGDDVAMFAGNTVDGPIDAYLQADIINKHALESSGGQTYAELDREDPARASVMNASFLRASLFTSVIAFGVAAFAAGMGVLFILVGYALRKSVAVPVAAAAPGASHRETPPTA